jgi:hypothetical protein
MLDIEDEDIKDVNRQQWGEKEKGCRQKEAVIAAVQCNC